MTTLYDIINILPLPLLAVILSGGYAGLPEGDVFGYILCAVFSLWIIFLLNMKRKNRLRCLGIAAVFVIGLLITAGEENRQLFLREYPWVIHILCLSAAALLVGILAARSIWAKRAVTAALIVYCVVGTILNREISKAAFALICFMLLVRLAEEIQLRWKKSGYTDPKEHITRISPILLAVCLAVYLIPAPAEPYDWQLAKDICNNTAAFVSKVVGYITHLSDDYGTVGFSDKGGFFGNLGGNDEEVLIITAGNTTIKNFRLVGCISGEFTGREWLFDTTGGSNSRLTDTLETTCAVSRYAGTSQSGYMQKTDMYCETLFRNTRYIFSPAKIRLEATREKNGNGAKLSEKNGSIVSEQRFGFGDNYMVSCYVLNYGNPDLPTLLSTAEPISADEWERAARAENVLGTDGYSYEDYLKYREDVYADYCRDYGLSEDAESIVREITAGSASRYEALKKLEAYLHAMEYSTDVGVLPDTVTDAGSFLDWFLFTSQKGYCMHYATAFVLMANEMGIPCRYVQGYNVKRDISGNVTVKQSNAHAWPEAYFDNVGWVAFEPTPGYSVPTGWGVRAADPYTYEKDAETQPDTAQDEASDETETDGHDAPALDPMIFIIPSLAAAVFLLLFYIVSRSLSRGKYSRMSPNDKLVYLTGQNLRFLGYLGFPMRSGETLAEFSERIKQSDRDDIKQNIGFIPVYETLLYSDRGVTESDVAAAETAYRELRALAGKSRLRYGLLLAIKGRKAV